MNTIQNRVNDMEGIVHHMEHAMKKMKRSVSSMNTCFLLEQSDLSLHLSTEPYLAKLLDFYCMCTMNFFHLVQTVLVRKAKSQFPVALQKKKIVYTKGIKF